MIQGKSVMAPKLYDLLQNHKAGVLKDFNAVKPGIIQSYDSAKRTATIQISFKRALNNGTYVSYPILLDCPVVTLQGGGTYLNFPITNGDECLVLFADSNIDAWFMLGGQAVPFDQVLGAPGRRHDLSDGIAIVGLNSTANPIQATFLDGEGGLANAAGGKVALSAEGLVTVASPDTDLLTTLKDLITTIKAITTSGGQTVSAPSQAALDAIATQLETLLY